MAADNAAYVCWDKIEYKIFATTRQVAVKTGKPHLINKKEKKCKMYLKDVGCKKP